MTVLVPGSFQDSICANSKNRKPGIRKLKGLQSTVPGKIFRKVTLGVKKRRDSSYSLHGGKKEDICNDTW